LVEEPAIPLPLDVVTRLHGHEAAHTEDIRGYSLEFLEHAADPVGREVIEGVCRYRMGLFEDRRAHPRDDFVTGLVRATDEDGLGADDETLTNTLLHLAEHPDVQRLIDEPALVNPGLRVAGEVERTDPRAGGAASACAGFP